MYHNKVKKCLEKNNLTLFNVKKVIYKWIGLKYLEVLETDWREPEKTEGSQIEGEVKYTSCFESFGRERIWFLQTKLLYERVWDW